MIFFLNMCLTQWINSNQFSVSNHTLQSCHCFELYWLVVIGEISHMVVLRFPDWMSALARAFMLEVHVNLKPCFCEYSCKWLWNLLSAKIPVNHDCLNIRGKCTEKGQEHGWKLACWLESPSWLQDGPGQSWIRWSQDSRQQKAARRGLLHWGNCRVNGRQCSPSVVLEEGTTCQGGLYSP